MLLLNEPVRWRVELLDGTVVEVWADAAEGLSGPEDLRDYLFVNLMEIPLEQQESFEIVSETPDRRERVAVAVARFPRAGVARVT